MQFDKSRPTPNFPAPYDTAFTVRTNAINYEKRPETNNHNEMGVVIEQGHDTFFDDDTTVWYACTDKFCSLDIAVNSEVAVSLYRDGLMRLRFDKSTGQWSMKAHQQASGGQSLDREWQFCSPQTSFNHVVSILTYLSLDDEKDVWIDGEKPVSNISPIYTPLREIAKSIQTSQSPLVQSAALYTSRDDCSAPPLSQQTTPYDGDRTMSPPTL